MTATRLEEVLAVLRSRPATLGAGRLLVVDGPAASGKSTFGAAAAAAYYGSRLVHLDDLYEGWGGLPTFDVQLDDLLRPLGEGRPGSYRRYDWVAGQFAETVTVEPAPLLVLEGVGSGASRFADLVTVLVWVEAPHDLRMQRGIERDGTPFAAEWERWARDEAVLFARERTRERADVLLDGTVPFDTGPTAAGSA